MRKLKPEERLLLRVTRSKAAETVGVSNRQKKTAPVTLAALPFIESGD